MDKRVITNPTLTPTHGLSRAIGVRGGETIYIGGQVASKGMAPWRSGDATPTYDANVVGKGDLRAQVLFVFERLRTIVEQAGGSLDDVVKLTMYMVDMGQYATLREIRNTMFTGAVPPVMTVLGVRTLSHPDFLIEMDAIAVLPER